MGRFRRQFYDELESEYKKHYQKEFNGDESYKAAYRKVKKIKGFYSHLRIYVIVNLIIIVANLNKDIFSEGIYASSLTDWHTYSTAFFWGIGLLAHAISVFGRDFFFNEDWEQKKIQKYMEKEAANAKKWE
jgi:hypothetical protein